MSHGFRSAMRLAATVATAAAVLGVAATARRLLTQPAANPPRHRASHSFTPFTGAPVPIRPATAGLAPAVVLTADLGEARAASRYHPFGPEPSIPSADVIELEASGELDGEPSPTERLLARRHSWDEPVIGSARDAPRPVRRFG